MALLACELFPRSYIAQLVLRESNYLLFFSIFFLFFGRFPRLSRRSISRKSFCHFFFLFFGKNKNRHKSSSLGCNFYLCDVWRRERGFGIFVYMKQRPRWKWIGEEAVGGEKCSENVYKSTFGINCLILTTVLWRFLVLWRYLLFSIQVSLLIRAQLWSFCFRRL